MGGGGLEFLGMGARLQASLLRSEGGGKVSRYNLANLALVCTMGGAAILKSCNLAPLGPLGPLGPLVPLVPLAPLEPLGPLAPFLFVK